MKINIQNTQERLLEERVQEIAKALSNSEKLGREQKELKKQIYETIDSSRDDKRLKLMELYAREYQKLRESNDQKAQFWKTILEFQKACSWAMRINVDISRYQSKVEELVGEDYKILARRQLKGGIT